MFQAASQHKKHPRIEFRINGKVIRLSVAGPASKVPGTINVTDGRPFGENTWYGRINLDGSTTIQDNEILAFLTDFATDPVTKARAYGKESGYCCFCGRLLTDDRSVQNGFGPICAQNYGISY